MANIRQPDKVKLFTAVLAADDTALIAAREAIEKEWGRVAFEYGPVPFANTKYYREQTGENILRALYGFEKSVLPSALAACKVRSNWLEEELAAKLDYSLPRPVNIDPGYLTPHNIVLASAKNFAHRIYLNDGIYAEVTLLYRGDEYVTLEWTFPDYASGDYFPFFKKLRTKLMEEREIARTKK